MVWWLPAAQQVRVVRRSSIHAHLLTLDTSLLRCACISVSKNEYKINEKKNNNIRVATCEFMFLDSFPEMVK